MNGIVIVGAGQAGVETAFGLRKRGFDGPVTLIGDETDLPYQRPPLSKEYLKSGGTEGLLPLRGAALYEKQGIAFLSGARVTAIDRDAGAVSLDDGRSVPFAHLVLATGSRNRRLPLPGFDGADILSLRDRTDADRIASRCAGAARLVVIGAGFIGLETAAALAGRGMAITVLEAAPRVMARAVAGPVSDWFEAMHRALDVDLRLGAAVAARENGAVVLQDGSRIEGDAVLVATGVVPNAELAAEAGLTVTNGIVTDATHQTDDPRIFAIGDCALAPNAYAQDPVRLESIANASEQSRRVCAVLTGQPVPDGTTPWFWSNQGRARLQIAGLSCLDDEARVVETGEDLLVVERLRAGRVVAVETVNAPKPHMLARKTIEPERALA